MKTTVKILACLMFFGIAGNSFAQQTAKPTQPAATKSAKKQSKKSTKAVDNKIAVSDQVQPTDKSAKKPAAKKDKPISNK
jgi:hypothetical protein